MRRVVATLLALSGLSFSGGAAAQSAPPAAEAGQRASPAQGLSATADFFYSADTDETEVMRYGLDLRLGRDADRYLGLRAERARYNPGGTGWQSRERIYLEAADRFAGWHLNARVGSDGDSLIGAVTLNDDSPFRKEFFIERDIVETRLGLEQGLYHLFAGAAIDLPVNERNLFTALAGLQTFTGRNERLHLRGSYIHVLQPELGLSAQLRIRYFHSSEPREYDYYSPRWYVEALPVLQLRRFRGGWQMLAAVGLGAQRESASGWRLSRFANARLRSPASAGWRFEGTFTYSSSGGGIASSAIGYSYTQFTLGVTRAF